MKVEVVTEASGIPIGVATDAARVAETDLAGPALADIPPAVPVRPGVPVVADRAYDSDQLRAFLAGQGFTLVAPHRRGRKRKKTADGRRLRRYKRRWKVERTFAWLGNFVIGHTPGRLLIAGWPAAPVFAPCRT